MKKKTKILGAILSLCASICMLIVGVLAANQVSLNVSSSVSFEAKGIYVKAKGEVQKGNDTTEPTRASEPSGSDYYYIGYSYDAQDEEQETDTQPSDYNDTPVGTSSYTPMTTWTIGDVEFSETENIIRYSLTFTNYSEKDIQATITTNKDTFIQDPDVQGKVEISETSTSIIIDRYYGGTVQTGTYTITIKLTDFSSSFTNKSLTIDVNFSTDVVYTPNYDYFIIEDNVITGLSDEYKNLETKPELLVIPGYSKETGVPLSINDSAFLHDTFNGQSALESSKVVIQEGMTSIGRSVFQYCSSLIKIIIPESVTIISDRMFSECTNLTSVILPESITSIGFEAFDYCISLTSITIPSNVINFVKPNLYVSSSAFRNCKNLTEINFNAKALDLPETIFSKYDIFKNAGIDSGGITLNIASEVTIIPTEMFYDSAITKVVFAKGSQCKTIGENAFYNCSDLSSITIPENVTNIGSYAFYGCSGLKEVTFNAIEMDNLSSNEYIFPSTIDTVNIGLKVKKIPNYLFYNIGTLNNVNISEASECSSIGNYAFYNCSNLSSIIIPENVTSIGSYAFYNCKNLTEINFNAIAMNDLKSNNYVFSYAGQNSEGITVNIGDKVTKIPAYLFYPYSSSSYIPKIINVIFNETSQCKTIGSNAFYNCKSLTSITIPESITSIGTSAFYNCSGLQGVYISSIEKWCEITFVNTSANPLNYANKLYLNNELVTNVVIPEGVTTVKAYTFSGCSDLTNVTIPKSVTNIGNYAFYNCSGLTSVTIPKGVKSIGSRAFYNCSGLTGITIPEGVTSIGDYAFSGCNGLQGVYITSLEKWCEISFGNSANPLKYAHNLYLNNALVTELVIPEGVKSIGNYLFSDCSGLTSVTIPEGVTSIGSNAFYNCSGLTSITIPKSVTSIGSSAFYGCSGLQGVYITSLEKWCEISFGNSSNPLGYAHNLYLNNELVTELVIPEGVKSIGNYAFSGCSSLTDVTILEGVKSIGSNAFQSCSALTSITIPESVTSIGTSAFYNCSGLQGVYISSIKKWCEITFVNTSANPLNYANKLYLNNELVTELVIPEGVKSIGSRAFYNCSGLTSVTIPASVTSIGSFAFYGCSGLTSITIPENVTSIGNYAFYNCKNLTEINFNAIAMNDLKSDNYVFSYAGQNSEGITVNIGEKVTKVPAYLFHPYSSSSSYVPKITNVIFNEKSQCKTIGINAFYNCSSLTSIIIPESVISIGSSAFENCSGLTSITIPESVTSMGRNAFTWCDNLKYIYLKGNLDSSYSLSGTWVKTDSADMPANWSSTVTSMQTAGYYHQKSAWDSAA